MELTAGLKNWASKDPLHFKDIQLLAVVASVFLTLTVVLQDHLPNNDGVLYLLIAELIASGELESGLELFNWPFYAFLIAGFHTVSGLSMEVSAYVVNGLLQALLVYAFIGVVAEMGAKREVVLVAAFLILTYPSFNELRSEIIRGFGYWAFVMLGLLFFLRYARRASAGYLFAWIAALAVATLFRFEGGVLLALMPFALLLFPDISGRSGFRKILSIYVILLLGAVLLAVALSLAGVDIAAMQQWNKPFEMLVMFYTAVTTELAEKAQVLRDHYLIDYSEEYAWPIVWATLLIVLATEIGSSVGLVYGLFAGYALLACRDLMRPGAGRAILYLAGVNILIMGAFVVMLGFLTKRYPVTLTLLVLLLASFGALALYRRLVHVHAGSRRRIFIRGLFVLVAVYFFVDGVFSFAPGKPHVEDAADWLAGNTSSSDRVFSLDTSLLYRAGKLDREGYLALQAMQMALANAELRKNPSLVSVLPLIEGEGFDYVVALVKRKRPGEQEEIESALARVPVKEFRNRKGDLALIYATGKPQGSLLSE